MPNHERGPLELDVDLLDLPVEELRRLFSSRRGVVVTRLLRSAILEVRRKGAFKGNLRALWHDLPEQVLSRLAPEERGSDPYAHLSRVLSQMVLDDGLLQYEDLSLTDPCWEERRIGTRRPAVVVMSEKRGQFRLLREVHEETGATVCVTGGYPSGATAEYTARDVMAAAGHGASATLIAIVDFDPYGWEIARAFASQLGACGLRVAGVELIVRPEHFPPRFVASAALPIRAPRRHAARVDAWLRESGGVGGRALRLECEALPFERILELVLAAVQHVPT